MNKQTNRDPLSRMTRMALSAALALSAFVSSIAAPGGAPQVAQAGPTPPAGTWITERFNYRRTSRVDNASANITAPAIKWAYPVGGGPAAWMHDVTGPGGLPDGTPELITYGAGRVRAFDVSLDPPALLWQTEQLPYDMRLIFVGDVDGDGSVELIVRAWQPMGIYALRGSSGVVLSRIAPLQPSPVNAGFIPAQVDDADNDGRMEVFFYDEDANGGPTVYSYANGAASPVLRARFTALASGACCTFPKVHLADFDGDTVPELVYDGNTTVRIARTTGSSAWTIVSTVAVPSAYASFWITDVASGPAGLEILRTSQSGYLQAINVNPANLNMTIIYTQSVSLPLAIEQVHLDVADLDGSPGLEVVLSKAPNPSEIRAGPTGALLATAPGQRTSVHEEFNVSAGFAIAQLDADAPLETVLQDATNVYVYQGLLNLSHTLADASIASLKGPTRLIDSRFGGRYRNFAFDVNGDSINELLVVHRSPRRLAAYDVSGASPILRGQYVFPAGVNMSLQYFGDTPFGRGFALSGSDGFMYVLDATFNLRARVYAGLGTVGPFVLDTNGDGRREVLFVGPQGEWVNLDPLTATFRNPPLLNYVTNWDAASLGRPGFFTQAPFVPVNSTPPAWAFTLVDVSQAPTYTLQLRTKSPAAPHGEAVVVSRVFTEGYGYPTTLGLGQFVGGPGSPWDLFISLGGAYVGPGGQLHGLDGGTLGTVWTGYRLADSLFKAVIDANGDGADDLIGTLVFNTEARSGSTGVNLIASPNSMGYRASAMVDHLDNDAALEAVFYGGSSGNMAVYDLGGAPALKWLITDTISALRDSAAIAGVTPGNGRDIVYGLGGGLLYAYEGVNGTLIYSRALGIGFDTGTCAPNINAPISYPGWQRANLEALCPGAGRFADLGAPVVANIDGEPNDEILVPSANGYLYALNAENGTLRWAYNFYYPIGAVIAANVDNDSELEVLVSVADGYLYALDQADFAKPQAAWDGPGGLELQDIDIQVDTQCFQATWRATSDPVNGLPEGFRVAIRDESSALVSNGYLNVPYAGGAVASVNACYNDPNPNKQLVTNLLRGKRYFAEVISYKGARSSAPTFSDGALIAETADFSASAKSVQPSAAAPGDVVTWTVTVRNTGVNAGNAQLNDPIPLNMSYYPGSVSATSGAAAYNAGLNRIEWSGTLASGQVATVTFRAVVDAAFTAGVIQNQAEIIDLTNGAIFQKSATLAVNSPNLSSAVKQVSSAQSFQTGVLTYTVRVTNTGTATATGTLVDDPLPSGVTFVAGSLSASGGAGSAAYNGVLKRVRWTGSLGPAQTLEVTFRVQVAIANGVIQNCAQINDGVSPAFQRCATTVVGIGGPLVQAVKTSDRLTYDPGDVITYTIVVSNVGTQPASVTVNDPLPAGVTVLAASHFPGGGAFNYSTGSVSWQGALNSNNYVVITIRAQIGGSVGDGVLTNRAFITNTTTNTAQQIVREVVVGNAPFINGDKQGEPLGARPGDTVTYTIRLFNTGTSVAANAVLTDPLPFGTAYGGYAAASVGAVSYNAGQQRLEWSGPVFITQPTVITWTVVVRDEAPTAGTLVNQAFSYDNVSDYDQMVATTAVNVPQGKALIHGYVYSGTLSTPLAGALVSASGLSGTVSAVSNASGFFSILVDAGSQPQNYAVFLSVPSGLVALSPSVVGLANVVDGDVREVVFRVAAPAPPGFGWVKGVVFNDANSDGFRNIFSEPGIPGVTVQTSSGQSAITDNGGNYFFQVPAGSRTVTQTNLAGWASTTPDAVTLTVLSQGDHKVDFGDRQCLPNEPACEPPPAGKVKLMGYVYADADLALNLPDGLKGPSDTPLAGVTVQAFSGATPLGSATTNAAGYYEMNVDPAAPARVQVTLPSGYLALTPNPVTTTLPANLTRRVDFGLVKTADLPCNSATHGIVNGFVYSDTLSDGDFIIGVDQPTLMPATVSVLTQTQSTNWMYGFVCVPTGSQAVNSTNPAGYTNTTPNAVNANVPAAGSTQVDFGKAFQSIPIGLRYAYLPIVFNPTTLGYAYLPIVLRQP